MLMRKTIFPLLLCASCVLTSCTQISISAFKAHTVSNVILRNQESVEISSAYTFTYTSNSFNLDTNGDSRTYDISQSISYSNTQMYLRIDTNTVSSSTIDGVYSKEDVNETKWVYVKDQTSLYIVTENRLTNNIDVQTENYIFDDDARFAFESYYALLLPHYRALMLGTEHLKKIISIMETMSFENEYTSQDGTTLSQKYASSGEGNLNANIYINFLNQQREQLTYTGSNSISAIYKNNILIDYLEKFESVAYEGDHLSTRQYNTITSSFKDRFVQIIKPNLPK